MRPNMICVLAQLMLTPFVFAFFLLPLSAQDKPKNQPLTLSINVNNNLCLGEDILVKAELRNASRKSVVVNRRDLWRQSTETAMDRYSSPILRIPEMRAISSDSFNESLDPGDFVTLGPGEDYSHTRTIDAKVTGFYKTPGRYSLEVVYGQYRRFRTPGSILFVGSVTSNRIIFNIRDCSAL